MGYRADDEEEMQSQFQFSDEEMYGGRSTNDTAEDTNDAADDEDDYKVFCHSIGENLMNLETKEILCLQNQQI